MRGRKVRGSVKATANLNRNLADLNLQPNRILNVNSDALHTPAETKVMTNSNTADKLSNDIAPVTPGHSILKQDKL